MAAGVRPLTPIRTALGAALVAGLAGGGCGRSDAGATNAKAEPVAAAVDSRTPHDVIAQVLERCHGRRRGTFGRCVFVLREDPDTAEGDTFSVDLPDAIRCDQASGAHVLLRAENGFHWTADSSPRVLSKDELAEWRRLRSLCGAMLLQPLYQAREPERTAPERLRFRTLPNVVWELDYDPGTSTPRALRRLGESDLALEVRFLSHLDTGVTKIPEQVRLDDFGVRHVRMVGTDFEFDERSFLPPDEKPGSKPDLVIGATEQPVAPELQKIEACSWLSVDDPGGWAERRQTLETVGSRLGRAGKVPAGETFLFTQDGQRRISVRFRTPDGGAPGFAAEPGEELVESAEHVAAVVLAPTGKTLEERIERGQAMLDKLLGKHGLHAAGPVRVVLNLMYDRPDNDPALLQRMPVRLEMPVEQ